MTTDAPFFPADRRGLVSLALLAAGLALYLSLFRGTLIDDAFITLSYARSLVTSATWGFYPGHVSNTATSPLNVMLLALASPVTRNPVASVFLLTWLEFLVMALCLRGLGGALALPWFAPLAFTAMVMNPLLMSTLGLESVLLATLLVAALYCYVVKRLNACAVVCALFTLTRPDGALLFVVILPFLPGARARLRSALIFGACLAPWYLFSWVYLGSLLPDSLFIKVSQSWGIAFSSGLRLYLRRYPWETILSFLWLPIALLALLRSVRALGPIVSIIAGYLGLHYVAYTILRVPPYHWYYVPEAVSLLLLGTLALATLARSGEGHLAGHAWTTVLVLATLVPLGGNARLVGPWRDAAARGADPHELGDVRGISGDRVVAPRALSRADRVLGNRSGHGRLLLRLLPDGRAHASADDGCPRPPTQRANHPTLAGHSPELPLLPTPGALPTCQLRGPLRHQPGRIASLPPEMERRVSLA